MSIYIGKTFSTNFRKFILNLDHMNDQVRAIVNDPAKTPAQKDAGLKGLILGAKAGAMNPHDQAFFAAINWNADHEGLEDTFVYSDTDTVWSFASASLVVEGKLTAPGNELEARARVREFLTLILSSPYSNPTVSQVSVTTKTAANGASYSRTLFAGSIEIATGAVLPKEAATGNGKASPSPYDP